MSDASKATEGNAVVTDDASIEVGYRVENPNDPPDVPRRLVAIDPKFQAAAERILLTLRKQWLDEER